MTVGLQDRTNLMSLSKAVSLRVNSRGCIPRTMERDGPSVQLGNGIEVACGDAKFFLDPRKVSEEAICCISHAHSDHMPSSFAGGPIHCSDITLRCMRGRVKSKKSKAFLESVELGNDPLVEASGAGHILGSNMFMLEAGQKVLYTGDFCPQDRLDIEGARPRKCDVLIVEATYGNPRYKFPDRREMIKVIHDWVEDVLHQGYSAVLHAYPLGKSQELITMLRDFQPRLHGSVLDTTRLIESDDLRFDYLPFDPHDRDPQLVISPGAWGENGLSVLKKKRSADVSGWCLDTRERSLGKMGWGMDQGFAYSDHADFYEIIDFVEKCSPSLVYTNHGSEDMLAHEIQKRLGITAIPLKKEKKGQMNLGAYC